ncbi:MAG: hypothetical protein ACKVYV_06750 [Limisphaerales bacterium]
MNFPVLHPFTPIAMKTLLSPGMLVALALLAAPRLPAATFSTGSDGSYGALTITNNTVLPVTSNGVFHCTTITIGEGATLSFTPNELNTPVYLLAQGDVSILGAIDVGGQNHNVGARGGPGGFAGGASAKPGLPAGDGHGPGGGGGGASTDSGSPDYPGNGSFGGVDARTGSTLHGRIYGNSLLVPLIGGSGGGGRPDGYVGGGGGGAILIASDTSIFVTGAIRARGGVGVFFASGSGGGVRLVAPAFNMTGFAVIDTRGGNEAWTGRIRIDRLSGGTLHNLYGVSSIGSFMSVFPAGLASLVFTEVAGTTIPEGSTAAASLLLPVGASTNQTVKLLGRNFVGTVPIEVAVTPENGPTTYFEGNLVAAPDRTGTATIGIQVPANVPVSLYAWPK